MFNILDHKGNADENYTEIPPLLCKNGNHAENKQILAGTQNKKGTLLHCWWECKLVQLLWKKL
jgi:hypothetical protein